MIFSLDSAPGTIDLPPTQAVIELFAPPLSEFSSYFEYVYIVDESGNNIVDESGNKLAGWRGGQTRSNVIELGV